jgi:glycosyltransferase involved in cell wall biosynthesis
MKNILISSFDMEVGGVERSLISMLDQFDYSKYKVDLMLYKHQGDFMKLISTKTNLLDEIPAYSTFRKPISQIMKDRQFRIGSSRVLSKLHADVLGRFKQVSEPGYYQMQLMWKYALPFLPTLTKEYDVAISYLWPHYFIADKVKAKKKIAWIHTDYSNVETNMKLDLEMWSKFHHIVAVSEACKDSFLSKYRELANKVIVIENITSPEFIKTMASKEAAVPMLSDDRFKIVTVARLSHAKGIDNAVKSMKILKDKGYQDIVWYIVGYGGDEGAIKELIHTNGLQSQFILLGKQINPYPYIKACDLYVQPSRYEGKAVTVTEAKILGKPILITKYPTAGSQVEDGIDGVICELGVEGIADGVEHMYNKGDLRTDLINYTSRFDYGNTQELEKLYGVI